MEPLILEILGSGLHRYHLLDRPEVRIGRALDNDIILSDATVAPHHIIITHDDSGKVELRNLSEVNPARFDGKAEDSLSTENLPINLELGRVSARILSRKQQVPETKSLTGNGGTSHIFRQTIWAVLLVMLYLFIGGLKFYLDSFNKLGWDDILEQVLRETALVIAASVLVLSILERLLVNRWEIIPVTVAISLVFLLHNLLSTLVEELVYLFSSSLPLYLFNIGWYLVFIPIAIWLYLVRVAHVNSNKSALLAIFIAGPFAILSVMQDPAIKSLLDDFSPSANYQKSLSALNWHVSKTVSIDTFIVEANNLEPGEFAD
ncbi:MAG: FHA domain-containing protein [Gammaproteobacteria bacterium]